MSDPMGGPRALTAALVRFLRDEASAEARARFPRLSRVPSTTVRRFLAYERTLAPAEREHLRSALASRGAMLLGAQPGPLEGGELAAFEAYRQHGLMGGSGFSAMSLRMARNTISGARSDAQLAAFVARQDPVEVARIASTPSARADQLRRLIGPLFLARFGLKAANKGGGDWTYTAPSDGTPLVVSVDYSGMSQLRYRVGTAPVGPVRAVMLNLEGAFGLISDWDWITEAGAQDAAELLAECVAWCAELPSRAAVATAAH